MIEWKPIKTVPKNRRPVLLWDARDREIRVGEYVVRGAGYGVKKPCFEDMHKVPGNERPRECLEGKKSREKCMHIEHGGRWCTCREGMLHRGYMDYLRSTMRYCGFVDAQGFPIGGIGQFTHWAEINEPEVTND